MKTILVMVTLLLSQISFAQQDEYLDDLESLNLNVQSRATIAAHVNYPGYRIGGGRPAEVRDCLIMDIIDSDHDITLKQEMAFAKKIKVLDGFMMGDVDYGVELKPVVKGTSVVFYLKSVLTYMTHIKAVARADKTLQQVIEESLLPSEDPTSPIRVNLLYVRGCRL